jgi:hypothetical protein
MFLAQVPDINHRHGRPGNYILNILQWEVGQFIVVGWFIILWAW